jgi:glycosyltransferase involved in cell wall biosynthesis
MDQKHIIVVLGMHRSGTSAITRGLQVLGVNLGERLMAASSGNNEKGFWEDLDVNALNIDLLAEFGHDWNTLTPLLPTELNSPAINAFRLRAIQLLRDKLSTVDCFGIKDPRIAKLLPFWESVFDHLNTHVSYVIACRHPMSVARSLAKRDGLATQKSYQLWWEHTLASLSATQSRPRVVVDYDQLMDDPSSQLKRIAKTLGLEFDVNGQAFAEYQAEFLEEELRHSRFLPNDLNLDNAAAPQVGDLYCTLLAMAFDQLTPDAVEIDSLLKKMTETLQQSYSILQYTHQCEVHLAEGASLVKTQEVVITEQGAQIASLNDVIAERNNQLHGLNTSIADQEALIANLNNNIAERDSQLHGFNLSMAGQEALIATLNNTIAERDSQLCEAALSLDATKIQIANIESIISERDNQIHNLTLATVKQEHLIVAIQETTQSLYASKSWRVTAPLRYIGRSLRKTKDLYTIAFRLRQNQSLTALIKKAIRVWRREGLNGLKARARQQHFLASQLTTTPLAFTSNGVNTTHEPAYIVRDLNGRYELASAPRGYTYIEPQRPVDIEAKISNLNSNPLFSIVVPTYNTTPELLSAVLSSVDAQWYPHWELILVDDASPNEETRQALAQIDHPKIKVHYLEKNQGISGATNFALEAATGDFIVFMDHDDELTVDCLYELALCIDREEPDFIYSDEDKITEDKQYTQPHYKPDWSPDTMMSTMFTCHVSCVRRSLLSKVGGLRSQFDGCQDWDFVLRVTEHTDRISHIPKILYHWRILPASIASDIVAKPYVLEASRSVRTDALERRGLKGNVEPVSQCPSYFRVNYELQGEPLVSIIIPSRDNHQVLKRCIDSIYEKSSYRKFEIIIIDNGSIETSTISYLQELQDDGRAKIIRHDAPFNFSELNNIGVTSATGDLLVFLNDDTEVLTCDWLERMGGYAQLPHIGAVGAKLLYPGGNEIQHAGVLNLEDGPGHAFLRKDGDSHGYFMRNLLEYNWLAVTGACLMMETKKFNVLGGFDESLPVAYNDIELCIRCVENKLYNVVCQAVTLVHHESVSRGIDHVDPIKLERLKNELKHLYSIHPRYFQHDPFYNPNLHPNSINFEMPQ